MNQRSKNSLQCQIFKEAMNMYTYANLKCTDSPSHMTWTCSVFVSMARSLCVMIECHAVGV